VKVNKIKHMAIAVNDVNAATAQYEQLLGVENPRRVEWEAGRSKEAHFKFGEVEIQLCQGTDPEGRFAQHIAAHGEGLQHMCLEVDDIDEALQHAIGMGAELVACKACNIVGSHPHSEGWVAFLQGETLPGFNVEFMQVYTDENRPAKYATGV
jgi:methylmalonyl-CoA/ethylmalonyl-CoA epimerase